ncbi:MAG: flagellar basal body-associated FliL family protein [Candidatus Latescibacterota bacterium]
MADEASGGSVLKKWGPLAAMVLVAQVVLAWVVLTSVSKNAPAPSPQEEFMPAEKEITAGKPEETRGELPHYYTDKAFDHMTANPAGTNSERFVMFSIQLGLVARDMKEDGKDITAKLATDANILGKLTPYNNKIKAIAVGIVRLKTVDELEGEAVQQVQDEIRDAVNREVMTRVYAITDQNKIEVTVQEVAFSDIIIQ